MKVLRHYYEPAIDIDESGIIWIAWIALWGKHEQIRAKCIYPKRNESEQEMLVSPPRTFLLEPSIVCNRKDQTLIFWVENRNNDWRLFYRILGPEGLSNAKIVPGSGKKVSHQAAVAVGSGGIWIAWQEHQKRGTVIYLANYEDRKWGKPILGSPEEFNAYDPCITPVDNGVQLAYSSYRDNLYGIYTRSIENKGFGDEQKVSWQNAYSYYPSITTDREGGAWIAWVCHNGCRREKREEKRATFVQTPLRHLQNSFWFNEPHIYITRLKNGQLWIPDLKKSMGDTNSGKVPFPKMSNYPKITSTRSGQIIVFARGFEGKSWFKSTIWGAWYDGKKWYGPKRIDQGQTGEPEAVQVVKGKGEEIWFSWQVDERQKNKNEREFVESWIEVKKVNFSVKRKEYNLRLLNCNVRNMEFGSNSRSFSPLSIKGKRYWLVFGNLHRHTEISPCCRACSGSFDLNYRHANDVMNERFSAMTDHGFSQDKHNWLRTRKMAKFYNCPGHFIAFSGWEWTSSIQKWHSYGHLNTYYLRDDQPCWTASAKVSATPKQLWRLLKGRNALTIPHHVADKQHPIDWRFYNFEVEPVVEIFQDMRGSGEFKGCHGSPGTTGGYPQMDESEYFVRYALERGYRLGFVAGGDHCGVSLAGVYVKELNREGVFEALNARRCFATSGCQMRIDFRLENHPMGSIVKIKSPDTPRRLKIYVEALEKLETVTLVCNCEDIFVKRCAKRKIMFIFTDTRSFEKESFYYIRILQRDGEIAYSSPIWVSLER